MLGDRNYKRPIDVLRRNWPTYLDLCVTPNRGGFDSRYTKGENMKRTIGGGWTTTISGIVVMAHKLEDGRWLASATVNGETFTAEHDTRKRAVSDLIEIEIGGQK